MRNPESLLPEEEAFAGHFSAQKADLVRDAIMDLKLELREKYGELWDLMQESNRDGVDSSAFESRIRWHQDYIEYVKEMIAKGQIEFDIACEEAGKYINPDRNVKLALVALYKDHLSVPPVC